MSTFQDRAESPRQSPEFYLLGDAGPFVVHFRLKSPEVVSVGWYSYVVLPVPADVDV